MVSSASRVARVTALLTYSLVLLVTDLPTCSTHAGLYSSSQVIAIVVNAGDSLGKNGSHVGLNTFSGNGLSRCGPHLLMETIDGGTFAEPYSWEVWRHGRLPNN